jgi:hypothetical protein
MLLSAAALSFVPSAQAQEHGVRISAARAAAIHECSMITSRYPETTSGSLEFELYRACMAEHGEVE